MPEPEAFYRTLLDEALDIIVVVGRNGTVRYASPSFERLLGYQPDELTGRHAIGFIHPDDLAAVLDTFAENRKGGVRQLTFRVGHKDGAWRTLEAVGRNLFDDPVIGGAIINARDVTKRREAETRYKMIVDAEPECVKVVARDGTLVAMNPAGLEMLEVDDAATVVGRPVLRLVTPEYRVAFETFAGRVLGGANAEIEFEMTGLKGTRRHLHSRAVPLRDDAGRVSHLLAITRDVTAQRRAELVQAAMYRISEATHRTRSVAELLAQIHTIVGELMPARNFYVALHDEAAGLLTFPYFADERDTNVAPRPLQRGMTEYVLRTGAPLLADEATERALHARGEVELIGPGSLQWLGVPLHVDERVIGVVAVQSYDPAVRYGEGEREILEYVSAHVASAIERKRAAQRLAESHDLLEAVVEGTGDAIFAKDLDGRYLLINSASLRLLGRPREDLQGRLEAEVFPPDKVRVWQEADRRILASGVPETTEWTEPAADGERLLVVTKSPLRDRSGRTFGVLGVVRDVTDRRRLERQLRQAQKMEAIGRLAGGVAHDFNNVLSAVFGYVDLLSEELPRDSAAQQDIAEVRKAAERAASLTRQLLAFSRQQVLEPVVLEPNDLIADVEKMLRRVIGEDVELRLALRDDVGNVRADPGQLQQVIMNLVVNARDAMPEGGKLIIETANADLTEQYVELHQPVIPGPYIMLAVSDTGTGMTPEVKARIFEPFFTTKEKGKGTGLGLSTVYGIVKQSGGYIWAYSELGHGTTFKIYLPRVDAPAEALSRPKEVGGVAGTETILLAEDDALLRRLAKSMLEKLGYTVLDAANADEALALAATHTGSLDLLVADVVMPGVSGRELARLLATTRPKTRVLYISGYTDDAIVHHGILEPGLNFLQKPFTPTVLARKVRDVLDAK